jgi:hypothetical protein
MPVRVLGRAVPRYFPLLVAFIAGAKLLEEFFINAGGYAHETIRPGHEPNDLVI